MAPVLCTPIRDSSSYVPGGQLAVAADVWSMKSCVCWLHIAPALLVSSQRIAPHAPSCCSRSPMHAMPCALHHALQAPLTTPGAGSSGAAAASGAAVSSPYQTVLLLDHQGTLHEDEEIASVVWGGGPRYMLAAAGKQSICFFSLEPFFAARLRAAQAAAGSGPHSSAGRAHGDGSSRSPTAAAAAAAAQAAAAAAQTAAMAAASAAAMPSVSFVLLDVYRAPAPLRALQWTQDAAGLLYTDSHGNVVMLQLLDSQAAPPAMQGAGQQLGARGFRQAAAAAQQQLPVVELWKVTAGAQHTLIAAGATPCGPCAGTSRDSPKRVLIWWPSFNAATNSFAVGAEVIRHPVPALSLEWSPVLSSAVELALPGSPRAALGSPKAASPAAPWGSPKAGTGGGSGEAGAAVAAPHASHPALMTLGADWVIRIWVEVVMADITPGPPASPAPGSQSEAAASPGGRAGTPPPAPQSMSQFCLTLVIEPPAPALHAGLLPGMQVSWARPLAPPGQAPQPQRMLWLVGSFSSADPAAPGGMGAAAPQDLAFLWAVDSLAGVVLSGIAQNAITASKLSSPRAMLWGGAAGALAWRRPEAHAGAGARRALAAWMQPGQGAPVMAALQGYYDPAAR